MWATVAKQTDLHPDLKSMRMGLCPGSQILPARPFDLISTALDPSGESCGPLGEGVSIALQKEDRFVFSFSLVRRHT